MTVDLIKETQLGDNDNFAQPSSREITVYPIRGVLVIFLNQVRGDDNRGAITFPIL